MSLCAASLEEGIYFFILNYNSDKGGYCQQPMSFFFLALHGTIIIKAGCSKKLLKAVQTIILTQDQK
jgi:hypothetical protein